MYIDVVCIVRSRIKIPMPTVILHKSSDATRKIWFYYVTPHDLALSTPYIQYEYSRYVELSELTGNGDASICEPWLK